MAIVVPPGGFAGASQMTPASRAAWGSKVSNGGRKRGRKKGKKAKAAKKAKKRNGGGKLKFGSPAWQRKHNPRYKGKKR